MTGPDVYRALYGSGSLNRKLFLLVNHAHSSFLDSVMPAVTFSGGSDLFPLYLGLLVVLFLVSRRVMPARYLAVYLGAGLLCFGVESFLKEFFHVPRPYFALGAESVRVVGRLSSSFALPSGHAVFAFMTAHALSRCRSGVWRGVLFLWAILVAYSRVYLGAHFPLDVLVGALVGITCSEAVWRLYEVCGWYGRRRGTEKGR